MKYSKWAFLLAVSIILGCSGQRQKTVLEIGFGKADLTRAGIFEDPVSDHQGI